MLEELLDLRQKGGNVTDTTPSKLPGIAFLELLEDDANAFDQVKSTLSTDLLS